MKPKTPPHAIRRRMHRRLHDALFYKPRAHRVSPSLDDEELELLERKAKESGMKRTPAFKKFALAQMRAKPLLTRDQEQALLRIPDELNFIGRNVNQLVRHAHATGDLSVLRDLDKLVRNACAKADAFFRNPRKPPSVSPPPSASSSPAGPANASDTVRPSGPFPEALPDPPVDIVQPDESSDTGIA